MQLGIRLHDTKELPFEERIANVSRLGYRCGHLALDKVIQEFSCAGEALTPGLAMYVKNVFARDNVDISVLGCYWNLATPNREQLERTLQRYKAHIRFASWLGCGVVGTETGAPNEAYTYVPECHSEEALQIFIANLRSVVKYAESMGVVVAIEPVWKHIVYNSRRARQVLDEIASPNLQIILDPVNLLDICNYQNQVEIVDEAIALLGADVAVAHIKDYVVEGDRLLAVGAGLGQMDYSSFMKFIKERKPYIHTILENTTPENNLQAKAYIQKMYDEI